MFDILKIHVKFAAVQSSPRILNELISCPLHLLTTWIMLLSFLQLRLFFFFHLQTRSIGQRATLVLIPVPCRPCWFHSNKSAETLVNRSLIIFWIVWVDFFLWISLFKAEFYSNYCTTGHLPLLPAALPMWWYFLMISCKVMSRVWVLRQCYSLHVCKKGRKMNIYNCLSN